MIQVAATACERLNCISSFMCALRLETCALRLETCGDSAMRRLGCNSHDHPAIGRRELLQVGALSLIGTGLTDLLRLEADAASSPASLRARAKSVVFIFQSGGPSQYETFDPKPQAPTDIRGDYGTTATRLAGVHFCEYLPKLAA